jgi:glycosyltransferase involved in cell wall biosynthesis
MLANIQSVGTGLAMGAKQILHVVTLLSDRNIYGGPVGVATDFLDSPPEGYELSIFSGFLKGDLEVNQSSDRVFPFKARRALPIHSFSVLFSMAMLAKFVKSRNEWSLVHIHLARDLITLPMAFLCVLFRIPFVVQAHGMLDFQNKIAARILDFFATRPILRKASTVLYLTSEERMSLQSTFLLPDSQLVHLPNAAPLLVPTKIRAEVFQVSFIARLHPRKRASDFVDAANELRNTDIDFLIAGHDQGEEAKVLSKIRELNLRNVRFLGAVSRLDALKIMGKSHVLVLPSSKEPYPLSVIESLTLGTPVVVTDECGLAELIVDNGGGIVFPMGDKKALALAILRIQQNWQGFHEQALNLSRKFSRQEVNVRLSGVYEEALNE